MNYYRRYIGDYHKKTMRLTPTDHGVYGLMLDFYYSDESPLPLDMDDINAICKAVRPEDRRAVVKVLAAYFERKEDGYHNERADEEIAAAKQARINGKGHTGGATGKVTGGATGPPTEKATETVSGGPTDEGTGKVTGSPTKRGGGSGHPSAFNLQPTATSKPTPSLEPSSEDALRKSKRARRLSEEWELPEDWLLWALSEQPTWIPSHAVKVAASFRDYWIAKAGKDAAKVDWEAVWRNWVRKEGPMPANGEGSQRAPNWWQSDAGIEAKARELGMTARGGETYQQLKGRISERLKEPSNAH